LFHEYEFYRESLKVAVPAPDGTEAGDKGRGKGKKGKKKKREKGGAYSTFLRRRIVDAQAFIEGSWEEGGRRGRKKRRKEEKKKKRKKKKGRITLLSASFPASRAATGERSGSPCKQLLRIRQGGEKKRKKKKKRNTAPFITSL